MGTYEGWSNRETWAVCLWMDNDQGTYATRQDWCAEAARDGWRTDDYVGRVADMLRDFVADMACSCPSWGLFSDLGGRSATVLNRVDYNEIAGAWWLDHCEQHLTDIPC